MDRPTTQDGMPAAAVTVWWAWCSRSRPLDASCLSARERARVDRLHLEADRERSTLARVVLRRALAERLGQPAASIEIDWDHGPKLDPRHGLWVSTAHSQDGVVVAVSSAGPVGVDIEALVRGQDLHSQVRERVFTQRERDHLASLPVAEQSASAVELWTVKEAVLKAAGGRLTTAPASIDVELGGGAPRLARFDDHAGLVDGAHLVVVPPPGSVDPGYVATVAIFLSDSTAGAPPVTSLDANVLLG